MIRYYGLYARHRESDKKLNHTISKEKHKILIEDIQKLEKLYNEDVHFQKWCQSILDIEKYQTALEDFERKYALANSGESNEDWADVPGEDYYIPCLTMGSRDDNYNPYLYANFMPQMVYYVREDVDRIIAGEHSGEECFAAWWVGKFNTLHIPEIYLYENRKSYTNPTWLDVKIDYKEGLGWFERNLRFGLTIWSRKELMKHYNEAMKGLN